MQSLFETSNPSFGYMTSGSMEILNMGKYCWEAYDDGPLITMDAGPNVHFLWRREQKDLANQLIGQFVGLGHKVVIGNE